MKKGHSNLLEENKKLIHHTDELNKKLTEANEILEAIKTGNIDAVFSSNNETVKVLVTKTADYAYRKFIENMSEGVITVHTDGIITYSNSSFAKMVNHPLEKVIGKNVRTFIPPEYLDNFERFFTERHPDNSKLELSILNSKGTHIHLIASLNALQLSDFLILNLVWTDVTHQKEAEEKVKSVNQFLKIAIKELKLSEDNVVILNSRLRDNIKILELANIDLEAFAHIASHDLQEPLRKIITNSSLLINEYYNTLDQQGQKYINNMQKAAMRMRNLISDILEYSQVSHEDFLFESTNLNYIINDIITNFEDDIVETKAKIKIAEELPVIEANVSQMRQLFQNLLSNSLKFIKPGCVPEINISYEIIKGNAIENTEESLWDVEYYKFYIKDNGIGFDDEYLDKIFTIFQRLHNNSVYPGTGIGLAICKKIVEKHSGFISAQSKLTDGSLFIITLPARQETLSEQNPKTHHKLQGKESM